MEKVAPSERFRRELDEVLAGVGEEHDPVEVVGRLGARLSSSAARAMSAPRRRSATAMGMNRRR
jgi:hypothetical protein